MPTLLCIDHARFACVLLGREFLQLATDHLWIVLFGTMALVLVLNPIAW